MLSDKVKDILNEIKNKFEIEIDPKTIITEDQKYVKFGSYSIRVRDFYSENLDEYLSFSIKVNLKKIVKEGVSGGKAKKEEEEKQKAADLEAAKAEKEEEAKKEKEGKGKGKGKEKEKKDDKRKKK